jgi:uncharacterized protein (DUF1015 family)
MTSIIKPFCAIHYNPSVVKDISSVVCPPYDIIDKNQLSYLRRKSPYNFSWILLADNNNYREIGTRYREWLRKNILIKDKKESLYLYEQRFSLEGKEYKRLGIVGLLRMDRRDIVFPHEHTLRAPKEDRKRIIEEVKANLSPIFVVTPQSLSILSYLHKSFSNKKPFFQFIDPEGNKNFIWKIEDRNKIRKICNEITKHRLVIADGHHRFEVSYDYYKKNKKKFKDLNYILAYITGAQKGLLLLPTHRIVRIEDGDFLGKLKEYFYITKTKRETLEKKLKRKSSCFSFGIYVDNHFYFIRLKKPSILDKIIPNDNFNKELGRVYKQLDTYLLHNLVFSLLKIENEINYSHSIEEAIKIAGREKVAFILRQTPLKKVLDIANKGLRMPEKSTYFYPKVFCGMLIRGFEK